MKGDFTRLTFRPQQHFTSVRMQQGRLQLDSDWNEQVDIQSHLYRTQAVDMIGSGSGTSNASAFEIKVLRSLGTAFELNSIDGSATTADQVKISTLVMDAQNLEVGQLMVVKGAGNKFQINQPIEITAIDRSQDQITLNQPISLPNQACRFNDRDLSIASGNFYVDGILCESAVSTPFELVPINGSSSQGSTVAQVSTLNVDGFTLAPDQWIVIKSKGTEAFDFDYPILIVAIDAQLGRVTLDREIDLPIQACRIISYQSQPNYPKPGDLAKSSDFYAVYLDVWERHITAVEDPTIREKALGIPDTTTRTQTVWQLKLKPLDELPPSKVAADATTKPEDALMERWQAFTLNRSNRRPLMNACAQLCNGANGKAAIDPMENQLYRVEIHKSGKGGVATFKWSRDNASTASAIKDPGSDPNSNQDLGVKDNKIVIQFDQQEWQFSQPGQWLEITTTDRDLKGEPGVLVPFQSASLRNITFDRSRLTGGEIPQANNRIVRRWHVGDQPTILTRTEWIELEQGIKVKFNAESDYETGDYWLIPARIDDIEWPNDGAKRPLAQPANGIEHHYGLLGMVGVDPLTGHFNAKTLIDQRLKFPPLKSCIGAMGGILTGTLEVQNDLYITHQGTEEKRIDGKLGIGTKTPIARFHLQNAPAISGKGTLNITAASTTISGTGVSELHPGYVIDVAGMRHTVTVVNSAASTATLNESPTVTNTNAKFTYQPAIARLEDGGDPSQTVALVTASGNVGIGTEQPTAKLDVHGSVMANTLQVTGARPPQGGVPIDPVLTVVGNSSLQGDTTIDHKLTVLGASTLQGGATISAATINNGLTVIGTSSLQGGATISTATVNNGLTVGGVSSLQGGATISTATINNGLTVLGASSLQGGATIATATINNGLTVRGASSLQGGATISTATVSNGLTVGGASSLQGGAIVTNITVTGTSTLRGNVTIGGGTTPKSTLTLGGVSIDGFSASVIDDDRVVPTAKAVQDYVDSSLRRLSTQGFLGQDLTATRNLTVNGVLRLLHGRQINCFSDDAALVGDGSDGTANTSDVSLFRVPTQTAVKTYVDGKINSLTNNLTINQTLTVLGSTEMGAPLTQDVTLRVHGIIEGDRFRGQVEQPSSRYIKENIADLSAQEVGEALSRLHPVKFSYKVDAEKTVHAGFIAEDSPDLLTSADKQAVNLTDIVAVLTRALKDDRKAIVTLSKIVKQQQQEIARLTEKLNTVENDLTGTQRS